MSTVSKSAMVRCPMPAPARYMAAIEPRAPQPTMRICDSARRC